MACIELYATGTPSDRPWIEAYCPTF